MKFRQGQRIDGRIEVGSDRNMHPVITMPGTHKATNAIIFFSSEQSNICQELTHQREQPLSTELLGPRIANEARGMKTASCPTRAL